MFGHNLAGVPAPVGVVEFERRAKIAELVLKEREIASKEAIVAKQMTQNA